MSDNDFRLWLQPQKGKNVALAAAAFLVLVEDIAGAGAAFAKYQ